MSGGERLRQARALLRQRAGGHQRELVLLGLPVVFDSNSPEVLEVVDQAFANPARLWPHAPARPLWVRILVQGSGGGGPDRIVHRPTAGGRLLLRSAAAGGVSDPGLRAAAASVSPSLLEDRERFRHELLEALTWALLTRFDRQPVHAAGLTANGTALLIAGGSGAGKSTLTYAAARAGMGVLGDDVVFLQSRPRVRAWGHPRAVRLAPEAAARFPELAGASARATANGKQRVIVELERGPSLPTDRFVLCVLAERRERAELRPITGGEALSRIDLDLPGFSVFSASIRPVLHRLTRAGAWLLHPELDPHASLRLLQQLLDDPAPTARWKRPDGPVHQPRCDGVAG
jgi:hypothetical protein